MLIKPCPPAIRTALSVTTSMLQALVLDKQLLPNGTRLDWADAWTSRRGCLRAWTGRCVMGLPE